MNFWEVLRWFQIAVLDFLSGLSSVAPEEFKSESFPNILWQGLLLSSPVC